MRNPLFFMHVAKTGGTSLAGYLDRHFSFEDSYFQVLFGSQELSRLTASPTPSALDRYSCIEAHAGYDLTQWFSTRPVTITVLRDPVDRLVSHYYHDRRSQGDGPLQRAAKTHGLLDYCKIAEEQTELYNPATAYLTGKSRVDASSKTEGLLNKIDLVGTLPRLNELCYLLAGLYGWRPPRAAPQLRSVSTSKSYPLPPETRELLRRRCWADDILYKQADVRLTRDIRRLQLRLARKLGGIFGLMKQVTADADSTYDMLLRAYIADFRRTASEIDIGFDQPISGDGWHLRETDWRGNFWRWTGPSPSALLDLPVRVGGDIKITVWIINPGSQATFESLSFRVNGEQLHHSIRSESSQLVATMLCPAPIAVRDHAVTLEVSTPVQNEQALVDPATPVQCGVAVSRVQVHPA